MSTPFAGFGIATPGELGDCGGEYGRVEDSVGKPSGAERQDLPGATTQRFSIAR